MAITIKRSKLTVKSAGLNESDAPEKAEWPVAGTAAAKGRVLTARAVTPAPSYTVYGILGLIAFLLMGGLVLIQYLELDYYFNKPPAVFPIAGSVPVAAAPAPASFAPEALPAGPNE